MKLLGCQVLYSDWQAIQIRVPKRLSEKLEWAVPRIIAVPQIISSHQCDSELLKQPEWVHLLSYIAGCDWLMFCGFSADAENINSHNEAELRRQFEERQQETEHVYELLENKIQLLQEVSIPSYGSPFTSFLTALPPGLHLFPLYFPS